MFRDDLLQHAIADPAQLGDLVRSQEARQDEQPGFAPFTLEPVRHAYFSNSCFSILRNDLNSSALPLGSSRNIVACSPGWPLKRTCGSITNRAPRSLSLAARACHSLHSRIRPKWGIGTASPSTGLVALRARAPSTRCAESW